VAGGIGGSDVTAARRQRGGRHMMWTA
jgi:hypothetical protein